MFWERSRQKRRAAAATTATLQAYGLPPEWRDEVVREVGRKTHPDDASLARAIIEAIRRRAPSATAS